jgi:hypothetical protein
VRVAIAILLWMHLALGCGYQVLRRGTASPEARRVAIETLENDSTEPGLELMVTDAIRRELLSRGGVLLVSDPGDADLVVEGRVMPVQTRTQSFSSVVLALEYTLTLTLDLKLRRADGRRLDLDPLSLRDREIYLASADVEAGRKNRQEALRRVAGLLASRVLDAVDRELLQ